MKLKNTFSIKAAILFIFSLVNFYSSAQILTIDKATGLQDTTKHQNFFANINLGFNYIQEEVGILNFNTGADLSYFLKKDVIYSLTQYSLSATDKVKYVNAGFSHLRYRINNESKISPEFFAQYQWDEVRGMKNRALAGSNLRFTLASDSSFSFYAAIGLMYEYEVWDYRSVSVNNVPIAATEEYNSFIKLNSYFKIKKQFSENADFIFITYIQTRPDKNIIYPRISSSARLNFKIYKKISYALSFNSIYDFKPVVPIRNFYYSFSNTISIKI